MRTARMNEVLSAFASHHDELDVAEEPGEWGGYRDKLATQAAAGPPPDVVQKDEKYLLEHVERGALVDLSDLDLDTEVATPTPAQAGGEFVQEVSDGL